MANYNAPQFRIKGSGTLQNWECIVEEFVGMILHQSIYLISYSFIFFHDLE